MAYWIGESVRRRIVHNLLNGKLQTRFGNFWPKRFKCSVKRVTLISGIEVRGPLSSIRFYAKNIKKIISCKPKLFAPSTEISEYTSWIDSTGWRITLSSHYSIPDGALTCSVIYPIKNITKFKKVRFN